MNPIPYLRRARDEVRQALAPLVDLLPDAVREIARDAMPFVAVWVVWFIAMVFVLSAMLPGCTTTGTTTGLAPSIEFLRDGGCVPDHGVRLVIDGAEYQLPDVEERMRLSVAAGAHRIVHYVGSYEMRRWTVTVSGRVYITLQCLNGQSRKQQKREEVTR